MNHAEQEQILFDYFEKYGATINLTQWAAQAELGSRHPLKFFITGERGLSPDALAKCWAYLKKQAQDTQIFLS